MNTYELLRTFDLEKIEGFLDKLMPDGGLSFGQLVVGMMSGDIDGSFYLLWSALKQSCLYGFSDGKKLFATLLLFGIMGALLKNASGMLKGKQAMQLAGYFVLLLAALSLFQGFDTALTICQTVVSNSSDFMRIFLPVFCLSLGLTHGTMTAYGYYQFVFLVIYLLQVVLLRIFLPCTKCYLFLAFMNQLSQDRRFEGILHLLEKGISMGFKVLTYVVLGSGMLRSFLFVQVDHVNKTVLNKAIGAIPIVGDVTDSATQILLSCAALVKGSLGSAALIVLVLVCLLPLSKLLFLYASLQLSAAFLGILGEKELMRTVQQAGKGYFFLFQIAVLTLLTFALSVAMMLQLKAG
ncbi:MAG: stage III sporulation protein AE [Lachnospiraceae bacterium]|nr:stage III sporulation protein AE [Lachnospiraceae bacterium]